jgi:hypothetical protein
MAGRTSASSRWRAAESEGIDNHDLRRLAPSNPAESLGGLTAHRGRLGPGEPRDRDGRPSIAPEAGGMGRRHAHARIGIAQADPDRLARGRAFDPAKCPNDVAPDRSGVTSRRLQNLDEHRDGRRARPTSIAGSPLAVRLSWRTPSGTGVRPRTVRPRARAHPGGRQVGRRKPC